MEMCYDGALVMPSNYAVMSEEEMTYVEGGALSKTQKVLIVAAAVALGAGLVVALTYGQIALAAKIMGWSIKKFVKKAGAAAVAGVIATSLGVSTTITLAALNFLL